MKNNHKDKFLVKCMCYKIVNDWSSHEEECAFHQPQFCAQCDKKFKDYERCMNHYANSKCTRPQAQSLGQKSLEEIRILCRDNNYRRRLVKSLILTSDISNENCLLRKLDLPHWPAFKSTAPRKHLVSFQLNFGPRVTIHRGEKEAQALWQRIAPFVSVEAQAQALFGLNVSHTLQMQDPLLADMFTSLTALLKKMSAPSTMISMVMNLACKLVYLFKLDMNDTLARTTWFMDVALTFCFGSEVLEMLMSRVAAIFARPVTQGPNFSAWAQALVAILSALLFGALPSSEFISTLVKSGNIARGVMNLWGLFEKVLSSCLPGLYKWATGYPLEIGELSEYFCEIKEWYTEVQELTALDRDREIAMDEDACRQVELCYRRGLQFSAMAQEMRLDLKMISSLNAHMAAIKMVYDRAQQSGAFVGGPRAEPLVIQLYGGSGVGKSHMMTPLALELLKIDGITDPKKWNQEIYSRANEQDFWDAYRNQKVCLFDDFGQMRDSVAQPNLEFFSLIRMGNIAPCPLHMANLAEKNKTYFTSKVVILTTNTRFLDPVSLTYPEAVRRRIDVAAHIRVKPEFANAHGGVDPRKVQGISTAIYEISLIDPMTGNYSHDADMTYEQFVQLCCIRYVKKIKQSKTTLQHYHQLAAAPPLFPQYCDQPVPEAVPQIFGMFKKEQNVPTMVHQRVRDNIEVATVEELNWFYWNYEDFSEFFPEEFTEIIENFSVSSMHADIQAMSDACTEEFRELLLTNLPEDLTFVCAAAKENLQMAQALGLSELHASVWRIFSLGQIRRKRTWHDRFLDSWSSFTWDPSAFLQKAKEVLEAHPYVAGLLLVAPLVVGLFKTFMSDRKEPEVDYLAPIFVEEDAATGTYFINENPSPEDLAAHGCEISSSGDPKTFKPVVRKVEIAASGDPKTAKSVIRKVEIAASGDPKTVKSTPPKVEGRTELQRDPNTFNVALRLINNVYSITLRKQGKNLATLRGFFVKGRIFMTVRHLLPFLAESDEINIWNKNLPAGFTIRVKDIKIVEIMDRGGHPKDQILMELPRSVTDHADVTGSIINSNEMSKFVNIRGVLITPDRSGFIQRFGDVKSRDTPLQYGDDQNNVLTLRKCYTYDMETGQGDCGSPLLIISTQISRKIIGFHVAGNVGHGFSTPLNADEIEHALKQLSQLAQISLPVEAVSHLCPQESLVLPAGNFGFCGKSEYSVVGSTKTKLRPSPIFGLVTPPITAPAPLGTIEVDGAKFDPMLKGLTKCGVMCAPIDDDFLNVVKNDVQRNFRPDVERQRVLTNWESVVGIAGDDFAPPMKRTTSPGYPFRKQNSLPGKTFWLGSDDYKLDADMERLMDQRVEAARQGERFPTVWTDTLKDERRPLDKVAQGKTRVFSAGPIDYTLVFRKYFLGFISHVAHNRNVNEISVGTNVYSTDWSDIALLMQSKGQKVVAGDFSNFDGTLHIDVLYLILDIINDWYDDGPENALIRLVLWKEIVNSIHVCRDTIYFWTHSQPSGCPMTAILNSMYNSLVCRYVYLRVTKGTTYHSMSAFRKHVAMVAYGDDNLLNISDEIAPLFNQNSMAEAFTELGMTYTDEAKSGEVLPWRSLDQVQYLKRNFVRSKIDGLYKAPMKLEAVLEIANWIRECVDHKEACIENVETVCFELSLHPREIFDLWTSRIRIECANASLFPQILTYYEYVTNEQVKYGQIVGKTEALAQVAVVNGASSNERRKEQQSLNHNGTVEGFSPIAGCVPPKIQANQSLVFHGESNSTPRVYKNERVAMNEQQMSSQEHDQITTFVDDSRLISYTKPFVSTPDEWVGTASETMEHTIPGVLSRPVTIATGTFSDTFTTLVLNFPDILLQKSANVVDKLNYFEFLRADVRVRLVFNATPFQQGRYWMFFAPFEKQSNRAITGTIQNATGYPGVELDIATNSPVELTIPYCSPLSHYRLTNTESSMGSLHIVPLSNLKSGTTADSCSFTVFAWLINVQVSMPTGAPVEVPPVPPPSVSERLEAWAQMAVGEEQEQTMKGLISGPATTVASTATAVGKVFPAVSDITVPVAWISRAVAGVASAFGYNKPASLSPVTPFLNQPGRGYTNMDGLDASVKLAACPDNMLEHGQHYFSSSVDEMSIDYVKAKSGCVHNNIPWTSAAAVGSTLYYWANSPACLHQEFANGQVFPTTLAFLASIFRFWRGSIKYRLSFAKTAFHTGRIRVTFIPSGVNVTSSTYVSEFAHNWILDLSKSSELEFEIPYVSNTEWTEVNLRDRNVLGNNFLGRFATGGIRIEVLTALKVANASVSPTITGMLWHSGGSDLEFAVPELTDTYIAAPPVVGRENFRSRQVTGRVSLAPEDVHDPVSLAADDFSTTYAMRGTDLEAHAQIFNETTTAVAHRDQDKLTDSQQLFAKAIPRSVMPEAMCIGEKVTSLRQIIKRFGVVSRGTPFPYRTSVGFSPPGPAAFSAPNEAFVVNGLVIDPCYFGEKGTTAPVPVQLQMPDSFNAAGAAVSTSLTEIATDAPNNCPLFYISYLYRFYRGGKRYKVWFPSNYQTNALAQNVGTSSGRGFISSSERVARPVVVKRDDIIRTNGAIIGVDPLTSARFTPAPSFEHSVYPDLSGCIEFEDPYYSKMPISLVAEGTVVDEVGPLICRPRLEIVVGYNPTDDAIPAWSLGSSGSPTATLAYRQSIGAYRLMVAAADDFSFGYMVGPPTLIRFPSSS